mmetsp:Transcript_66512/g.192019  ORF Transcript_66512/g.192019 Transcript_66512/m.192019 type:complete len:89 (-) Transcript_66512:48-314(-)
MQRSFVVALLSVLPDLGRAACAGPGATCESSMDESSVLQVPQEHVSHKKHHHGKDTHEPVSHKKHHDPAAAADSNEVHVVFTTDCKPY